MLIVITGPIASGKSTVARAVARELEKGGIRVAVIDLDLVHDMVTTGGEPASSDATWAVARRAAATLANTLLEAGIAVVVAEGSFNTPGDRAAFAEHLDRSANPRFVTLRVSYEEALRRAQDDPTRGKSRDPAFLRPYFASVDEALAATPATDLVIDTERTPATDAAAAIARLVR
jgi:adenylylsulfate kinase-like enzyme